MTVPAAALALAVALAGSAGASGPGVRVLRLVDHSRRAHFANGASAPRVLVTYVRVPPGGRPPYPLVVFAHGFSLTPAPYARLLDAWADAGYVVAAPLFPVEGANAPGGPSESDLVNEPRDLGFVARRLTSPTGPLHGLVDPGRVAFAGHSDGAEAALAAAYDRRYRQPRVHAAVVLSGAAFPGFTRPPSGSPPLLAVQGTADPINPPGATSAYYRLMRRPKFLLWLVGASHLPPYSTHDRWFPAVARTTTAFLDRYLRGRPLAPLLRGGSQVGITRLVAQP